MNTKSFCTISTLDYMPYVYTLYDSLQRYSAGMSLDVFVVDAGRDVLSCTECFPYMRFHCTDDLCSSGLGEAIYSAYHGVSMDKFRWSMKAVFLNYLIEHAERERVIYVDNDIYFFNEYTFLFDELDRTTVILMPHWRVCDPTVDPVNFFSLYTSGLYNAGCVGVNKNAVAALRWWAQACLYICEKDASKGQFDDQAHLNLLPIYFEDVAIIKHRGCNVANWNQIECERVQKDGSVLINGTDPVVFIHFTRSTIRGILKGNDALLKPFLDEYRENVERYGAHLPDAAAKRHSGPASGARAGIFQRIRAMFNG